MEERPLKRRSDFEASDLPSFRLLKEDELQRMLSMSSIRKYEPGELLYSEGEKDSHVYFLVQGHVALLEKGHVVFRRRRRGDVIGTLPETREERVQTARAEEESTCLALDTRRFEDLDKESLLAFHYYFYRVSYPL